MRMPEAANFDSKRLLVENLENQRRITELEQKGDEILKMLLAQGTKKQKSLVEVDFPKIKCYVIFFSLIEENQLAI